MTIWSKINSCRLRIFFKLSRRIKSRFSINLTKMNSKTPTFSFIVLILHFIQNITCSLSARGDLDNDNINSPHNLTYRNQKFDSLFDNYLFKFKNDESFTNSYGIFAYLFLHEVLRLKEQSEKTTRTTTARPYQPEAGEDPAVSRFREYLTLDSSHPNPNYDSCIQWLRRQSAEIGLEFHRINFPPPALFTIRLTWPGSNPKLKSIMLNSHIDVVPADPTKWKYDPFAATKDSKGDIYARGAQDRKSLGAQYLEAIRRLKATGFKPLRTVHITYVPDEELGGGKGMAVYVNSDDFKALNIGMELDEGGATPLDEYAVYYGERAVWQFRVTATGRPSHAALMFADNAAVKLEKVIRRLLDFRAGQIQKLVVNSTLEAGDVTSINLSQLGGGLQPNVVPSEMWAIFDMRIRLEQNFTFNDAEKMLNEIVQEAGPGVRLDFILKSMSAGETRLDDDNIWWKTFKALFDEMNLKLTPKYFPGATDARFLRNANYTALGFSPLPKTDPLQHQDNEFLNQNTFLDGIKLYEKIIPRLTSVNSSFD